jgi:hypothetical protein
MDDLNMEHILNDHCFDCGIELTEKNKSMWSAFATLNKEKVTVHLCVICHEASSRQLSSCIIEGTSFIPQKTRKECLEEIKKEGLTIEKLKQIEIDSLETKQ